MLLVGIPVSDESCRMTSFVWSCDRQVLNGSQLPYRSEGSIKQDRGLLVQVRVTGVEADNQKEKTKTVKNTGQLMMNVYPHCYQYSTPRFQS